MHFMQEQRILSLEEYVQDINSEVRQLTVQRVFDGALGGLQDMMRNFYSDKPALRIKISRDVVPDAAASGLAQMVLINEGMIDHCLATRFVTMDEVFSNGHLLTAYDYDLVPQSMLAWVVVHEMTHIYRCHNEIAERHKKSHKLVSQALEWDADMFAAAYVYRMVQRRLRTSDGDYPDGVNDFAIRQFSLYSIYWALRLLVGFEDRGTHLPLGPRFFSIIQKLATINEEECAPLPFGNLMSTHQLQRSNILLKMLRRLERCFSDNFGKENLDLMGQIRTHINSGHHKKIERKWNHMRRDVSLLSGSIA